MKRIQYFERKDFTRVTVWYNQEWDEYQCVITRNGVPHEASIYFTGDVTDALTTAQIMLSRFKVSEMYQQALGRSTQGDLHGKPQSSRGGTILSQIDPNQPIWGTK